MINPNKTHLIRNCTILTINKYDGWMAFKSPDGSRFEGKQKYGRDRNFKIGQKVNLRVNYSIVGECYLAWQITKVRNRKTKTIISKICR